MLASTPDCACRPETSVSTLLNCTPLHATTFAPLLMNALAAIANASQLVDLVGMLPNNVHHASPRAVMYCCHAMEMPRLLTWGSLGETWSPSRCLLTGTARALSQGPPAAC